MSKSNVTTARGEVINLDEMIAAAKRPVGLKETKSELARKPVTARRPINVRGFVPARGRTVPPKVVAAIPEEGPAKRRFVSNDSASLADLTGVRVIDRHPGEKREIASPDEVLEQVLGELSASHPKALQAAAQEDQIASKRRKKGKGEDEFEE